MSTINVSGDIGPDNRCGNDKPDACERNEIMLGTMGEFWTMSDRPLRRPSKTVTERAMESFYCRIFVENAWFIHEHESEIMDDKRVFMAPVHTKNNLAYTGTVGFENPTIGVYMMWWKVYPECSIDKARNLIWYIAGSPISGSNSCKAVTPAGESVRMSDDTRFVDVWRSFWDVNRYYDDEKRETDAYTFEDALIKLRGKEYRSYLDALRQEKIDWAVLYNNKPDRSNCPDKKKQKLIRQEQMELKQREIMDFYGIFSEKEAILKQLWESGDMSAFRPLLHELAGFSTEFVDRTFGPNPHGICLKDAINFAKYTVSRSATGEETAN